MILLFKKKKVFKLIIGLLLLQKKVNVKVLSLMSGNMVFKIHREIQMFFMYEIYSTFQTLKHMITQDQCHPENVILVCCCFLMTEVWLFKQAKITF